ncbi:MAG: RNB domain-containing ribonuclease, partial [Brooklawnia sp.]|uniref:RNB domain-containing ribonuclease n=1 Tax=Brooklawnia sp. TaxID=2699740 RepID=UPI003C74DFF3
SEVVRAMVRNRGRLSYQQVQAELDAGRAAEPLQLLREVGLARQRLEAERGGVSLNLPDQEVVANGRDWRLEFRGLLPVEGWNAQVSLLTGSCAARLMLDAGVGVLRTLPPSRQYDVDRLRRIAKSLNLRWPGAMSYPEFVRSLDPGEPRGQAMLNACTLLFRGAAYTVIDPGQPEQNAEHAALAASYTHTTAPLRRLVDRYTGALCVELCAGRPAPEWVLAGLAQLPELMAESDRRAKAFERGIVNRVEALVLHGHEGSDFAGTIIEVDDRGRDRGEASIPLVAVEAPVEGPGLRLGEERRLRLAEAVPQTGRVLFNPA